MPAPRLCPSAWLVALPSGQAAYQELPQFGAFGLGRTSERVIKRRAKNVPRTASNARQKPGHQEGTPGFAMKRWWTKSKTPWPIRAATTNQGFRLKPRMANRENPKAIAISIQRVRCEAPIMANKT